MTYQESIEGYYLMLNHKVISNTDLQTYLTGFTAGDTVTDHSTLDSVYGTIAAASTLDAKAGYASTGLYLDYMYTQILGRAADVGGKTYWTERLDTDGLAEADFVKLFTKAALTDNHDDARFSEGDYAYTVAEKIVAVDASTVVEHKIDISDDMIATFVDSYDEEAATEILLAVTKEVSSVTAITDLIDDVITASGADTAVAYSLLDTLNVEDATEVPAVNAIIDAAITAASASSATVAETLAQTDIETLTDTLVATPAADVSATLATAVTSAEAAAAVNEVANTSADETLAGTDGTDNFTYDYASAVQLNDSDVQIAGIGAGEDGTDTVTDFTIGTDTITFNDISGAVTTQAAFDAVANITVINSGADLNFYFAESSSGNAAPILSIDNFLQDAVDAGYAQAADGINTLQEVIDIVGVDNVSFTDTVA